MEIVIVIAVLIIGIAALAMLCRYVYRLRHTHAEKQDKPKDVHPEPVFSEFIGMDGKSYGRLHYKGVSYVTNYVSDWYREPDFAAVYHYNHELHYELVAVRKQIAMRAALTGIV